MYFHILTEQEQELVIQALRGPQFDRKLHGGLFDRGSADSYYGRPRDPHRGGVGGMSGPRIVASTEAELEAYHAGYDYNEEFGDKKDWG